MSGIIYVAIGLCRIVSVEKKWTGHTGSKPICVVFCQYSTYSKRSSCQMFGFNSHFV